MAECKIFISYRRADTSGYAGRLYDHLSDRFGEENIFMDVEGLEPGVDFHEAINEAVSACNVLIALIGPQWLNIKDDNGQRRLDNPDDFVRIEITAALDRNIRVIPVLLQNASIPGSSNLPTVLKRLSRLNAFEIRHGRFKTDVDRLEQGIEKYLDGDKKPSSTLVRGMMYLGILTGMIVILILVIWGSNKLLPYLRDTATPTPILFYTPTISAPDTPQPPTLTPLITDDVDELIQLCPDKYAEIQPIQAEIVPIYKHEAVLGEGGVEVGKQFALSILREPVQALGKEQALGEDWSQGKPEFSAYNEQEIGTIPIYQHYADDPKRFAYSLWEIFPYDDGWKLDCVAFYAFKDQEEGTVPIYQVHAVFPLRYAYSPIDDGEEAHGTGWVNNDGAVFYAYGIE